MAFTNRYPGSCGKCGKKVPAGAGLCERVNGKFTAFHKSCGAGPVNHPHYFVAKLIPQPKQPTLCLHCGKQPCVTLSESSAADYGEAYDLAMGLVP